MYEGTPGVSDAWSPANANMSNGVPTMPGATNGMNPPTMKHPQETGAPPPRAAQAMRVTRRVCLRPSESRLPTRPAAAPAAGSSSAVGT